VTKTTHISAWHNGCQLVISFGITKLLAWKLGTETVMNITAVSVLCLICGLSSTKDTL